MTTICKSCILFRNALSLSPNASIEVWKKRNNIRKWQKIKTQDNRRRTWHESCFPLLPLTPLTDQATLCMLQRQWYLRCNIQDGDSKIQGTWNALLQEVFLAYYTKLQIRHLFRHSWTSANSNVSSQINIFVNKQEIPVQTYLTQNDTVN